MQSLGSGTGLEGGDGGLEYADEAIADRYFESGDPDYSYWVPDRPEGEDWFCLAIHDTDDGPVCWWARREVIEDMDDDEIEELLSRNDLREAQIDDDDLLDIEWIHDDVDIKVTP